MNILVATVICGLSWAHDNKRIDETPNTDEEMYFVITLPDGTVRDRVGNGSSRLLYYSSDTDCGCETTIKACDMAQRCSKEVKLICPPTEPYN